MSLAQPPPASVDAVSSVSRTKFVVWDWLVILPVVASLLLFIFPLLFFLRVSFFRDLGFGRIDPVFTLENYAGFLTDPLLLTALLTTVYYAGFASLVCLVAAVPTSYVMARARSRWISIAVALLLASSFISIIIKVLGLNVLLSSEGLVNAVLRALHLTTDPIRFLGNGIGVVIGLVHYVLPLLVLVLFSVFQTIPTRLEEAAEIHGASRATVFRTIIFPLSAPGILAGLLMIFNLCMGAFTTPAILGGGRVQVLPILIERKIRGDVDYPSGAAMAMILLVAVLLLNILTARVIASMHKRRKIAT